METRTARHQQGSIEGVIVRGGTSKGLFVEADVLPPAGSVRDDLLIELFGSPDPLQVNGIGGSRSHTSKLMAVSASDSEEYDVEYTFAQIGVNEAEVDWSKNCGNLTSAVGTFALLQDLVEGTGDEANLILYNTNTDTVIDQTVPLEDGQPAVYGDCSIDGVPGTGARIDTTFNDPAGGVTGALLPTGNPIDRISTGEQTVDVSLVDATNLVAFVRAEDFDLVGTELPADIEAMPELLERFERMRDAIRAEIGLEDAKKSNPSIGILSAPQSYACSTGGQVEAGEIEITSRWISLQPHHAVGMTGAMCLGATTRIPGTIPYELAERADGGVARIGHPKGTVEVGVDVDASGDGAVVRSITNRRTARPIMRGRVFYRYLGDLEQLR